MLFTGCVFPVLGTPFPFFLRFAPLQLHIFLCFSPVACFATLGTEFTFPAVANLQGKNPGDEIAGYLAWFLLHVLFPALGTGIIYHSSNSLTIVGAQRLEGGGGAGWEEFKRIMHCETSIHLNLPTPDMKARAKETRY